MLQISFAFRSEIDNDVDNRASRAADEFRFGSWRVLKVHAADRSLAHVVRNIRLSDRRLQTMAGKLVLTEGPREESAVVDTPFQIEDEGALKRRLDEFHSIDLSVEVRRLAAGPETCTW